MREFALERIGPLLLARAIVYGPKGHRVLRGLIDTGSTFTTVPMEVLENIGCSPAFARDRVQILMGSGVVFAPRLRIGTLQILDRRVRQCPIAGHTLPEGPVDTLISADTLNLLGAIINVRRGTIRFASHAATSPAPGWGG